jgi:hypothetical protein
MLPHSMNRLAENSLMRFGLMLVLTWIKSAKYFMPFQAINGRVISTQGTGIEVILERN